MANLITKEQVQAITDSKVKLVDIRSKEEYGKMHIEGSINIPAENLPKEIDAFSPDDTIVCVCNYGKERGQQAADLIYSAGFKKTFYLQGGAIGWNDLKNK